MENSSPTQNEPVNLNGQELLVFLWLYFIFLDKFEMLQNIFHNSHYLDQKSAGNLKLSSSFSKNLLTVALISTSFVNFPYNISQRVMKKSGNRSLGVKCHKNPSLKCQIFKTFPFPGERNKDKYLPLLRELIQNVFFKHAYEIH